MFKIRIVSERLTDNSLVYNVLVSDDDGNTLEFHAYDREAAGNFAGALVGAVQYRTCDVAEIVDLTEDAA